MSALAANGPAILFYVFAALAIVSALGVVTLRNPMYGALSLLVTFLSVAVLFILRQAEFVGMVQIFVYGGGIMVLFLFVIMLINLHRLPQTKLYAGQAPLVALFALVLVAFFAYTFLRLPFNLPDAQPAAFVAAGGDAAAGNTQAVSWNLFTQSLLPFEIASLFLLVAMIGAVVLGRRQ
ncbi:MAG TPA: NADH-quinone oxidoreductase subunit J [Thermoanaerobaculia bacterium]|jgi:NADH-quinone oxidoreductase subunit J|nr:NADH-quinone oxidoreductase subunit J [Thermoanaerobaculia bacterium]